MEKMKSRFKFPSTQHMIVMGDNNIRGDKLMTDSEREDFLTRHIYIEEKIDGANVGVDFDSDGNMIVRNRGKFVDDFSGQWKKFPSFRRSHEDRFFEYLSDRYILFGEWMYACHSIFYNNLPDYFIGFDIFDKQEEKFLGYTPRNKMFEKLGVYEIPNLGVGKFTFEQVQDILLNTHSEFGDELIEGVYLRTNTCEDQLWLGKRCKIVRPAFTQAIEEHWSRKAIRPNLLAVPK
jgi:ATP-dependent RNA circularization protein (DNA/RNA ligase family)